MNSQSDIKDQQLIRDLRLENKALERNNQMLKVELDNQLKDYGYLSDCLENELSKSNTLIEKNKALVNNCHFLDAEYTKRKFVLLQDNQNLKSVIAQQSKDYTLLLDTLNHEVKNSNDLASTVDKLRSDAGTIREKMRKYFRENQESKSKLINEIKELREEVQRLSILAVSSSTVVKYASENKADLTQSEIDFLKSYLSLCLTEAAEDITLLKEDAKYYKGKSAALSEACHKKAQKLKKKAKVLSGIQSKLKKTVLNRKVQSAPQVNQEGYEGHKRAWIAVCDAIEVYYPQFLSESGTGIECAVREIHKLGKAQEKNLDSSVDIELLTQQSDAWYAVSAAIQQYIPDMYRNNELTGTECAVEAVHMLGKSNEQWNKLQTELQNIMTLNLKGIK